MTKGTKFKLPSASKAGMQKKQGRNFLLPKEKPNRSGPRTPMPKPKPMPKQPMPLPFPLKPKPKPMPRQPVLRPQDMPTRPKFIRDMTPAKRLKIKKLKEQLKKLMGDAKPTGIPSFRERISKSKMK